MRKAAFLITAAALVIGAAPEPHAPSDPATATTPPHQAAGTAPHGEPATAPAGEDHGSNHAPAAKLPGFAAELSEMPALDGPSAWQVIPYDDAWAALARTTSGTRQSARWNYARSLLGQSRGSEALGVLDVMKQDDPDLALVPSWQLARGAALTLIEQPQEALAALSNEALSSNAEACAWRMRSMAQAGLGKQALAQVNCGLPAINARLGRDKADFVIAASRAAVDAGRPGLALQWLRIVADRDPTANLYRGKAYLALGESQAARLRLERVAISGTPEQRVDARLSTIETGIAKGTMERTAAQKQLGHIAFTWRGDEIEERALRLSAQLSADAHDLRGSLSAGAALYRYFDLGPETGPMIAGLQAQLAAALAPDSGTPISQAAGLYWDFRDLAPSGAEGDLLVNRLADRLQATGLYGRAAELLEYQLTARAKDVAQGPLSVKVASLYILSGHPERALRALRSTDGNAYPQEMLSDRREVEAAALHLLGKTSEALAVLQGVPNGDRVSAEIYWKKQDWTSLAALNQGFLPSGSALNEVEQTVVLRHAIALAMLGREDGLARLRARYSPAFAKLPNAATFDILTRPAGAIDSAALSKAMAALPSASPAGAIGTLLDAEPKVERLASS
jgi:hypothetical protein